MEDARAALEQTRDMLDSVGLNEVQDKYPHMLSGDMQQRLSIAQSVIKNPKVLLLDELTTTTQRTERFVDHLVPA